MNLMAELSGTAAWCMLDRVSGCYVLSIKVYYYVHSTHCAIYYTMFSAHEWREDCKSCVELMNTKITTVKADQLSACPWATDAPEIVADLP